MSEQGELFATDAVKATPMVEFLAGMIAHAAGVQKPTAAQRRQLARIAADAIAAARTTIRP